MSNETQRVIEGAYKILSSYERWTRRHMALDSKGDTTACNSREARRFCVVGAFRAVYYSREFRPDCVDQAMRIVTRLTPNFHTPSFNDSPTTTHADILALLRKAHKLAGDGLPEVIE